MGVRLRSITDLVRFHLGVEWVYAAGLVGLLVGVAPSLLRLPSWASWVLAAVGTLLAVALFVRDTFGLARRWSSWTAGQLTTPIDFDQTLTVPGLPTVLLTKVGRAAIDEDLDRVIGDSSLRVTLVENDRYRLPRDLAEIAPYVLRTSSNGRWPFNGPNVGLVTDITAANALQERTLRLRRGNFFSLLCSNELTGWVLKDDGHRFPFWETYLHDAGGVVFSLASSQLQNNVGVSTLAVTTDDFLVVTLQSKGSQASGGLWAPSGSGALEPQDVHAAPSNRLVDVVAAGATREFGEETTVRASLVERTRVLGYARWLDRGAKPEFFCVTALPLSSHDVRTGNRVHALGSSERIWTADLALVRLAPARVATHPTRPLEPEPRPLWRDSGLVVDASDFAGGVSLPLELALDALSRALGHDPGLLADLRAR